MASILPVDLPNLFLAELKKQDREPDGKLHASSDLSQPLRYVQLRAAGAPQTQRSIASSIRLLHGTLWHEWFHSALLKSGIKFRYEEKLDDYMPPGWSGTADWIFWHPSYEAWVLGDLKTTKGEAIHWITKDGAKDEHIWQLSAYWHALAAKGEPLVEGFGIMYWPMNDTRETVEILPTVQDVVPLPAIDVYSRMQERSYAVDEYLRYRKEGEYLTDWLAEMPPREQKLIWNKEQNGFDVKLVPLWYEAYCDFDETLCPQRGSEKIGHYTLEGEYVPRKDREDIEPTVAPTEVQFRYRRKEKDERSDEGAS